MMVILHFPFGRESVRQAVTVNNHSANELYAIASQCTGLQVTDFYLINNGKKINIDGEIIGDVHIIPRLLGGKGGFGSMLRAIGAQIEKTTNREACRDLSGRRLRDINEERRLKNWLAQKEDREREAKERKRKRIERLLQEPKVEIKDDEYHQQRSMLTENISDSVELGLQVAATSGVKRKPEEILNNNKKPKRGLLLDMDMEFDSDAEISSSDSEDEKPSTSGVACSSEKSNDKSDSASSSIETEIKDEVETDCKASSSSHAVAVPNT